jgi:hypothetical protein
VDGCDSGYRWHCFVGPPPQTVKLGHYLAFENHEHALAIHYMFYNSGRIRQSLRVTPAMEAGIADHVWSLEEIVRLIG